MSRSPIATQDQIRATVFNMLTEANDATPTTSERFRNIVSVRKLMSRLGGGDPATLGREIKKIESEIIVSGLSNVGIPGLPSEVADKMQAVWHAAVAVQFDDVVKLKTEARASIEQTAAALNDAKLRTEVMREELGSLRNLLSIRDAELAQSRTDLTAANALISSLQSQYVEIQSQVQSMRRQQSDNEQRCLEKIAAAQERYEGLSKQLMQETAHRRHDLQQEQGRVSSQLKFAERRISVLEDSLKTAEVDLLTERARAQTAVGEATAFKVVNASMQAQLDELVRAAMTPNAGAKAPAPSALPAAGTKKPAPRRKRKD